METDFAALQSAISAALVATTRSASAVANEDLSFHRSLDASLASALDQQDARLLGLATGLLGTATATSETVRPPPSLRDVEGIENNWRAVVDVVDSLLERADTALDEFTGAVKRLSPSADVQANGARTPKMSRIAAQLKAQDIDKPQLLFEHVPTNREQRPWQPLLLTKPHASVPLSTEPVAVDEDSHLQYAVYISLFSCHGLEHKRISLRNKDKRRSWPNLLSRYPHPYQLEIEQYRYPTSVHTIADPIPYHPFDSTTATFVDTEELLAEMIEELQHADAIAVDLEHHDQRSYIGLVSLMQISTRDKDWIVDTLKPWRRKLQALNVVFADPGIIKVLHGAYMDIVWLQRDLGLYVVGLFDTHYASRALGYSGGSLAYLLKTFVNIEAQKQHQLSDWRQRPLTQDLFDYARSDTHYLLYIFDCMRNELIQKSNMSAPNHESDKLWDVLQKSSETALQRYEHPEYDRDFGQGPSGWYKLLSRTTTMPFNREQFAIFRAVHKWRDDVAREDDDSVHWIMPNFQLFSIAREMPTNRTAVLGVTQPASQAVRIRVDELVEVIVRAKEEGKNGPEMSEVVKKVEPRNNFAASKPVAQSHSVAPFVQKPAETESTNGVLVNSTMPLRSQKSTFWGNAFESSAHTVDQQRSMSTAARPLELSVPLPALTAQVFAESDDTAAFIPVRSKPSSPQADNTSSQDAEDDDIFVLNHMGKKRKRPADDSSSLVVDGMAAQNDEIAIDDVTEQANEKSERKKARKEAKRAEKKAKKAVENGEGAEVSEADGGAEIPFDYANAPSILNPPRESKAQMRERKKKEVNPYAKSLDAPKGLPRVQREKAGRTMTYQ